MVCSGETISPLRSLALILFIHGAGNHPKPFLAPSGAPHGDFSREQGSFVASAVQSPDLGKRLKEALGHLKFKSRGEKITPISECLAAFALAKLSAAARSRSCGEGLQPNG
jgi:hypothetical protein